MTPRGTVTIPAWLAWVGSGLVAVLLVPAALRSGEPLWSRAAAELPQHLVLGIAFLVYAVLLHAVDHRRGGVPAWMAALLAAACFGAAYAALLARPDLPRSRAVFVIAAGVGTVVGMMPYLLPRLRAAGLGALALAGGAVLVMAPRPAEAGAAPVTTREVETAVERVAVTRYAGLVPVESDGGALAPYGDGFLLVTGDGALFELAWRGDSLAARALGLRAPLGREAFFAAHGDGPVRPRLRATGIAVDTAAVPARVYVAHQHWNDAARCLTLRVSETGLPARGTAEWRTIFETRPCVPFAPPYSEWETGGRLAWASDGALLLTTGDHGYDDAADSAFAQLDSVDYGKVVRLEAGGAHSIVSRGHRNPQGIAVARDGRVWLTEHGPQGGDEINLIEPGANYGWPLATYGTDYGGAPWPLAGTRRDHAGFREPAYVFVPAAGISGVIEVRGDAFAAWDGSLLAASLRGRRVFRAQIEGDRIALVEPVEVGERIRDLAQGRDGRIALWTDAGDVITLAPAVPLGRGEAVFRACAQCHRADERDAPDLRGVVGRAVASSETYPYSDALRALGGTWTRERLDAFLADPSAYAPGTRMWYRVADSAGRAAVLDYLARER